MKIVLIENVAGFREALKMLLQTYDHVVTWHDMIGSRTPAEVHAMQYDLALVDRRARDDQDDLDESGQDFATQLCALGTPTALLTGFLPPGAVIFDLLRTGTLMGVAPKSLDMSELASCVEEFRLSHRFPNCVARFRWRGKDPADTFTGADWDTVRNGIEGVSREECAVLFRSLIPTCATTVELQPITPGHGGATLFRAWVSSGDGPVVEDVAIKYGVRATIQSE